MLKKSHKYAQFLCIDILINILIFYKKLSINKHKYVYCESFLLQNIHIKAEAQRNRIAHIRAILQINKQKGPFGW